MFGYIVIAIGVLLLVASFGKNKETGELAIKKPWAARVVSLLIILMGIGIASSDTTISFKDQNLSQESVKTIDSDIIEASIFPQVPDMKTYYIEAEVKTTMLMGGSQDWNNVAMKTHKMCKELFSKPEVVKVGLNFKSTSNDNFLWARIEIDHKTLPANWNELTYLEFFSYVEPKAGSLETRGWLCEFYKEYSSAIPQSGIGQECQ